MSNLPIKPLGRPVRITLSLIFLAGNVEQWADSRLVTKRAYEVTSNLECSDTPGHLMGDIYDNLSKIDYVD